MEDKLIVSSSLKEVYSQQDYILFNDIIEIIRGKMESSK
jgi:hypothetical protein